MAKVLFVQHSDEDPVALLSHILNDPKVTPHDSTRFRVSSRQRAGLAMEVKGKRFAFAPEAQLRAGVIEGLVLYVDGKIAAQCVNCRVEARHFDAVLRLEYEAQGATVLHLMGVGDYEIILVK